jgi:hypothetical protein
MRSAPIREIGTKTLRSMLLLARARAVEVALVLLALVSALVAAVSSLEVAGFGSAASSGRRFGFRARTAALFTALGCSGLRSTVAPGTVRWWLRSLTIVGAGREALVVWRLGRWEKLCALGARSALLRGRSTSSLEVTLEE